MKMPEGKSKTMPMQTIWGVEAVYYGIVRVEKYSLQKLDECSLARALKYLEVLACLDFRFSATLICILKTKTDTGNNVSRMGNCETLGKHARCECFWKLTCQSSVPGSKVTPLWNILLVYAGSL